MEPIKAAAVQYEHIPNDKQANLQIIEKFLIQAHDANVDVVIFPECCLTGYWHLRHMDYAGLFDLAEPVFDGPTSKELMFLSKKYQITIGAGLVEVAQDGQLYNTYVVSLPDGRAYKHRKLHAFVNENISSGDAFTVFDGPGGWRFGVLICYDNNIIENTRQMALMGVDVLLAPHQTGGCRLKDPNTMGGIDRELWDKRFSDKEKIEKEFRGPKGREWLMRWLPSRAHDNGMYLLFSNGVGVDDDEIRTGNSMILDPYGRIIVETYRAGEDMVMATLDQSLLENNTGRRWIKTRRPELYELLVQRTGRETSTREARFSE